MYIAARANAALDAAKGRHPQTSSNSCTSTDGTDDSQQNGGAYNDLTKNDAGHHDIVVRIKEAQDAAEVRRWPCVVFPIDRHQFARPHLS